MNIAIISLFPEMFSGVFSASILGRAQKEKIVNISYYNPRDFANDKHKTVDDRPFGGGTGMLLMIEPIDLAIKKAKADLSSKAKVVYLSPKGKLFSLSKAKELGQAENLIILCGRYEGIDARIEENLVDESISIGDYVLSGGEIPAMAVVDSVVRLLPGVLKKEEATEVESLREIILNGKIVRLLEPPQYTRPEDYKGKKVPSILLSGNHAEIEKWRLEKSIEETKKHRPDLLE